MFNLNDRVIFSVHAYKENGEPIRYSLRIPEDINIDFKLPENTEYIQIKEHTQTLETSRVATILTIYLGEEYKNLLKSILNRNEEIIINDNIDLQSKDAMDLRVLARHENNKTKIIKVLGNGEKACASLEEMEKFIRVFSTNIASFMKKSEAIEKLIK